MGCGCGSGKKKLPETARTTDQNEDGTPVLRGSANPRFMWPPRTVRLNGPSAEKS